MNRILVTGAAGFIGFYLCKRLLERGDVVVGIDKTENLDVVVNLAAQAGVRYSLINPYAYIDSNIVGFTKISQNAPFCERG